jgi:hypothetical protein
MLSRGMGTRLDDEDVKWYEEFVKSFGSRKGG